ncbi:MAG: hypothetical protein AAFO03_25910, partial [Bacteroidota bacterium]
MKSPLLLSLVLLFFSKHAIAQWQPITSPGGAEIRNLVQSDDRVFASTFSGLYYTDNGGDVWINPFSGEFERGFIEELQVANTVVICRIRSTTTNELQSFISENGGESWQIFPPPPAAGNGFSSIYFNGQTIIYRTANDLHISTDLGENWTVQNQTNLPFSPNFLNIANGIFFMVDTNANLWRWDSLAENWSSVPLPLDAWQIPKMYVDGDFMMAGIDQQPIQYSTDGGNTWNSSSSIATWSSNNEGFWSDDNRLYTIHLGNVYASEDQGANWTQLSPTNSSFNDIVFQEDYTFFTTRFSIYQSTDFSQTLTPKMEGMQSITISDFEVMTNEILYHSNNEFNFATLGANEITATNNVLTDFSLDETIQGGDFYFANKFSNFGQNKHEIFRIAPDGSAISIRTSNSGSWLASDHLKYTDDKLVYFDGTGPYFSDDFGDSWQLLNTITHNGEWVYSFDFERHEDALFSIATEGVRRLRDGEEEWELVNNGLNLEVFGLETGVFSVRLKSTLGALFLFTASDDGEFIDFFVSHDGGENWQATATDLPDVILPNLNAPQGVKNIVTLGGFHIMALRDVGIAVSSDLGLNWTIYNDGLPTDDVTQLAVSGDRVIAATARHGFWE